MQSARAYSYQTELELWTRLVWFKSCDTCQMGASGTVPTSKRLKVPLEPQAQ